MTAHTLIVGGGIAGLATLWWLARAGRGDAVLIEAEPRLASHSSGLNAAILRTWIDEPLAAELARRSKPFLSDPPSGFGGPLVDPRGLVLMADREPEAARLERIAAAAGPHERLGRARLADLAPHVATRPLAAFFLGDEGRIEIDRLTAGLATGAEAAGARLRTGVRAARVRVAGGRAVGVETTDGEFLAAEQVVLAAGGWAAELGRRAGARVALKPTRRHLLQTSPDGRIAAEWPVVWNSGDNFYARPSRGGLLVCVCDQEPVDPDHCQPDAALLDTFRAAMQRHLPDYAHLAAEHLWCGMRTLTADERFAIGRDPHLPGLFWVAGLGGHGMTTAPELGRLAALSLGADSLHQPGDPDRLAALSPTRLAP